MTPAVTLTAVGGDDTDEDVEDAITITDDEEDDGLDDDDEDGSDSDDDVLYMACDSPRVDDVVADTEKNSTPAPASPMSAIRVSRYLPFPLAHLPSFFSDPFNWGGDTSAIVARCRRSIKSLGIRLVKCRVVVCFLHRRTAERGIIPPAQR